MLINLVMYNHSILKKGYYMIKQSILGAAVLTSLAGLFTGLTAEESTSSGNSNRSDSAANTINEVDQRVKVLERLREVDNEIAEKKNSETPVVTVGKDGFIFRAPDTSYQLRIRYEGHFDGRVFFDSDTFTTQRQPTFVVRRARPIIEARLPGPFLFRIMTEFGNGKVDVSDGYVESGFNPAFGFRIGKFKSPFSLDVLQSTSASPFLELSLASQLAPNRDIGLQLQGELGNGILSYTIGGFNGVADGASLDGDWNRSKDIAGRVFLQPFQKIGFLKNFGAGGALTFGNHQDKRDPKKWSSSTVPVSVNGLKSAGQESFFKYRDTTYASGNQSRYSVQGYYFVGPFGLTGEYISSTLNVRYRNTIKDLTNTGWYASVNYAITGEPNSWKSIKPFRNFDLRTHQWGALEVALRVGQITIDKDAFPVFADSTKQAREAFEFTGGLNWHLNRNVKVLLDYTQTNFTGGAPKGDARSEQLLAGRVQFVF
jgi:phosphate-selective porin OprO/OprP